MLSDAKNSSEVKLSPLASTFSPYSKNRLFHVATNSAKNGQTEARRCQKQRAFKS